MKLTAPTLLFLSVLVACHSVGRRFKSDLDTLSQLQVEETTAEEAEAVLAAKPYMTQNLADGTLALTWQSIEAGAYVGITDNRLLTLQFSRDEEGVWRLLHVLTAQNIDVPEGLLVRTLVGGEAVPRGGE